jgi:DnaJ-class molecular chaperone
VVGPPLLTPSDPKFPVCRDCERRWVAGDKPLHPRQCPVCRGKGKRMVAPDAPASESVPWPPPGTALMDFSGYFQPYEGSPPLSEKQRQKQEKEQERAKKKQEQRARKAYEKEQKAREKEQKKLRSKVSVTCDRCNGLGKVPQVSGLSAETPFRPTSEYVR